MGKGSEYTFSQRKHTFGQQIHEKGRNITNQQLNENPNHNVIPPHTCQNGYHTQKKDNRDW